MFFRFSAYDVVDVGIYQSLGKFELLLSLLYPSVILHINCGCIFNLFFKITTLTCQLIVMIKKSG